MSLPKGDAAILSARWTEGVLLKRDVFSTVERGHFRAPGAKVDAVLRRIDRMQRRNRWLAFGALRWRKEAGRRYPSNPS